eukprot:CAMPEP_0198286670 /NCGR_PEP_ID=MMETSP1449-20131203/5686_1 /TAXON_ID=420275 /ORGANISM="Attheya septentrionalis, Strain CCMP2084" /LENGTH=408 /DNA_ID=CAMNT_0043984455 /DNA_START=754 /DNA_END=1980 /DNA_ORIENTATION=-
MLQGISCGNNNGGSLENHSGELNRSVAVEKSIKQEVVRNLNHDIPDTINVPKDKLIGLKDENEIQEQQVGVPVNGFHPQWKTTANDWLPTPTFCERYVSSRSSCPWITQKDTTNNDSKITNRAESRVKQLGKQYHEEEIANAKLRKRSATIQMPSSNGPPALKKRHTTKAGDHEKAGISTPLNENSTSFFDLYGEAVLDSSLPQLMLTSGGRLIAWNDDFLKIANIPASQVSKSMTVLNFIEPAFLPNIFEMFSLALPGGGHASLSRKAEKKSRETSNAPLGSAENSTANESVAAITLPCVTRSSPDGLILSPHWAKNTSSNQEGDSTSTSSHLYMTITLMDDLDSSKRCFHCIISDTIPGTPSRGENQNQNDEIERLDQARRNALHPLPLGKMRRFSPTDLASILFV